jgi:hypothetical protein
VSNSLNDVPLWIFDVYENNSYVQVIVDNVVTRTNDCLDRPDRYE